MDRSVDVQKLLELLSQCPTSWHTARYLAQELEANGFQRLDESQTWILKKGGRYWLYAGPGSIIAFTVPTDIEQMVLLGCHTESPMLKIKDRGFIQEESCWMAHVEPYGSPILASWFFKDLGLAGRVIVEQKEGVSEMLVQLDEPIGILLSPPIHFDREMNQRGLAPDKQKQLKVLLGNSPSDQHPLESYLQQQLTKRSKNGTRPKAGQILAHDLFFYPLEPVRRLSLDENWITSWRIDNLASCSACLDAMTSSASSRILSLAIFANHEEIGSQTGEGAASGRYLRVINRLLEALIGESEKRSALMATAMLYSVDGAHGLHPAYSELYESRHKPQLGQGVVIKHHPQGRYATDARTAAKVAWHARRENLPLQTFHMRADMNCGSTIGPILSTTLGIEGVDIGLPQLAMHASREAMHLGDYQQLVVLLRSALESPCLLNQLSSEAML